MTLAERVLDGEIRAAARLMRDIDDRFKSAVGELKALYPHTGNAYILGLTGPPGAGKSTLVDQIIAAYRKKDLLVGVVAIDPTSPFTGGAILGDRIRMQRHAEDPGVLILSRFAGAARECTAALLVNPYDHEGVAIAINRALSMSQEERVARHAVNYKALLRNDLGQWAERFLDTLEHPRGETIALPHIRAASAR